MEYGIIASGIRNRTDENSGLEREEEEKRIRAQQVIKVLKFPTFDDDQHRDCLRMSERRDSGSELAKKQIEQDQEQEQEQDQDQDQDQDQQGQPGNYVLRDNPKKTKRFVVVDSKELKVCKECSKGFQSLKALCGHMACHSEKDRTRNNNNNKLNGHSDTESSGPKRRRRRRRKRASNVEGVSVVVEKEQQEVAISLMLLSRDYCGYKGNSVAESSSNGSVVLEAKSSSMVVPEKDDEKIGSDSESSDSGYFRNGPKKNEAKSGSGFGFGPKPEFEKDRETTSTRGSSKYELRKRSKNATRKTEALLGYYLSDKASDQAPQKKSKYECSTCNKTFASHTALGGHRASHAKLNGLGGCCGSICESGENSIETENSDGNKLAPNDNVVPKTANKKSKGHECPICFRMFKSGQALGGHKRSHFVGGREANRATVIRQEPTPEPEPEITVLFDLNLPASMEDEGFIEW